MKRKTFLTIVACIATSIGLIALFFPSELLKSKGVLYTPATQLWMSETGLLITSVGIIAFLIRAHDDSRVLIAFFSGFIIIQSGLFVLELTAYVNGIITQLSGVLPNLILHIILTLGSVYYIIQMNRSVLHE